jgi:hypothetical protein
MNVYGSLFECSGVEALGAFSTTFHNTMTQREALEQAMSTVFTRVMNIKELHAYTSRSMYCI